MKKQILFLAFLVLAIFSGLTDALGQAVHYSAPRPIACEDDALHPIPGRSYNYEASATPPGGTWHFWATKNPSFIATANGTTTINNAGALTTTTGLVTTSTDYNVNTNTDGNVAITWSSAILAATGYQGVDGTPTFVAAYYDAPVNCSDNIKVWELDPINAFTVDVLNLNPTTFLPATENPYDYEPEQCPDIVRTATYTGGDAMHYDFGTNTLYYEFVAANFTGSWTPTFELTAGLGTSQQATYHYTYALPSTWAATPPTWTPLVSGTTSIPVASSVTDTGLGVSIFVRVTIANNQWENLAGQDLVLTVNGQNAEGFWDVVNTDCDQPDPNGPDEDDTATQTITARPTITPITTALPEPDASLIEGDEEN